MLQKTGRTRKPKKSLSDSNNCEHLGMYLSDVVEVPVWYALLCSELCFLVEKDVEVEPRF